jgi:hypothetical protein
MLSRSMTNGRIRADSTPSQNGSAIDNQITCTDEPMTQEGEYAEHEEGLGQWGRQPVARVSTVGKDWECGDDHPCPAASHRPGIRSATSITSHAYLYAFGPR